MSRVNDHLRQKYAHNLSADVRARIQAKNITSTGTAGWDITSQNFLPSADIWEGFGSGQLSLIYTKSALIYACVREKATSIAEAPLQIGIVNPDGDFEPQENHELLGLFYNNPTYSYTQLMNLLVSRLETTGANYYMLSPFEDRRSAGELTPLPTHAVRVFTKGAAIIGYEVEGAKGPMRLDPEEMCAHMYLDPTKLLDFMPPLAVATRDYQTDIERQNLTIEVLRNRKIPGLILKNTGNSVMGKPQRDALTESLEATIGAETGSRASSIMLPKGIEIHEGRGIKDIDFSAINALTETRICMAFQVPPIIIGAKAGLDKATYANYGEARKSYMAETIVGLWLFISDGLTRCILKPSKQNSELVFRFDLSGIKELQKDLNEIAKRSQELYEKGVITLNEARSMLGTGLDILDDEEGGFKAPPPAPTFDDQDEDEIVPPEDTEKKNGTLLKQKQERRLDHFPNPLHWRTQ